jgi:DNA recombination protein RmuC
VKSVAGDVGKLAKALQVTGTPAVGRTGAALPNVSTAQQISQNNSPECAKSALWLLDLCDRAHIRSASRFRWTYGFVGAGVLRAPSDGVCTFPRPMLVGALIGLVVLAALGAGAVFLPRLIRAQLASQFAALEEQTARHLGERNADVDRRLAAFTETVDRRLASSGQTATQIHERLGEVTKATETMIARAQDLARLEQALRPPKARGGFGELLLENLLRDRLPPDAYELQYTFPSGERVDAIIRAADRLLPIDAKFPLDNFERLVAAEDDEQRQLHEKAFARDVKGHIDAIAAKYIRPDFGTFDLAFMYLPAEAIHYELIAGKTGALLSYAHEHRVFPVSATTFSAYLQMIVLGLRGLQIEQRAQEVMAYCAALQGDFLKFKDDFDVVGTHLGNAQKRYGEAEKRLAKFETRLDQAAEEPSELEPTPLPRALDAA